MFASIRGKTLSARSAGRSPRRSAAISIAWRLAALFLAACGPPPRGLPLYDASHGQLPLDQVARVSGEIIAVDGQRIKQDTQRFEVLPGCHMLRMTGTVGYWSPNGNAGAQISMGEHEFGVHTEAGHKYFVELEHESMETTAPAGSLQVRWVVKAFDAQGKEMPPVQLYSACR